MSGDHSIKISDVAASSSSSSSNPVAAAFAAMTESQQDAMAEANSLATEAAEKAARDAQRILLQQALAKYEQGATLDATTPEDGDCLFHAIRRGGFFGVDQAVDPEAVRQIALSHATVEQIEAAAASTGLTVGQYRAKMTQFEYGDNCMVAILARVYNRDISVISMNYARTFRASGTDDVGVDPAAVWIGHAPEKHYYAIFRCHGGSIGTRDEPEKVVSPIDSGQ